MIVTLKKATLLHVNGEILKPGPNKVDLAWWKEAKKHPRIKQRLEGTDSEEPSLVEEMDPEALEGASPEDQKTAEQNLLKEMKQPQALALVKETINVELLKQWAEVESRKVVQGAIRKQIEALTAPPEIRDRSQARQVSTGTGPEVVELKANPNAQDD